MTKKNILTIFLLFSFSILFSQQNDTIYGKVKKIREKVIFLTQKENPQLLYNDDYGHSGFMGPESTISKFHNTWYTSDLCYYINYERDFDEKGRIVKDIWYTKKDSFMDSFKYKYNKKDRLVRKIDSSKYAVTTETHYYNNYEDENIIYENIEYGFFSHIYKKYKDGKVIHSKKYNEDGTVDEYIYHYNNKEKLSYRIYKNPNKWKKISERSWSYGVQDSVGTIYKDLINEYDDNNRIIKTQTYDLYEDDDNHENPVLTDQTIYKYKGDKISTINKFYSSGKSTFYNFIYDKENRLIEKYCCDENISNAIIIEKYNYKGNKIISLDYSEESFPTNEIKNHKIKFEYINDDYGNWVEMIKKVNGVDLYKWIRKIEYYQ
ncbi:MAG: hypothetical protein Q7U08_02465 [Flavobacteriaceae bacterium]|nr:hypothetical protein [Flavobacteriaceae bacterium]